MRRQIRVVDPANSNLSAVHILHEITIAYNERGVGVHFVHLHPNQVEMFQICGITDLVSLPLDPLVPSSLGLHQIGPTHFHRDLSEAMKEIESLGYGPSITPRYT